MAVVLYFTLNAFVEMGNDRLSRVAKLLLSVCGIVMTLAVFRRHAGFFSGNNKIARTLKFIGKRTLDIYLLHYFFLFDCKAIFPSFAENNLPLYEFIASAAMSVAIVAACLLVSTVLRADERMAHYLFGAKKE